MYTKTTFQGFSMTVILVILTLAFSVAAQRIKAPPQEDDTAINPHDFVSGYYAFNGVYSEKIIGQRTGYDLLSVFSYSSNPIHTEVRVLATLPAYSQNGEILFWCPFGELEDYGFTDDVLGIEAREMAHNYPMYVFPRLNPKGPTGYTNVSQAAIIDDSYTQLYFKGNPLGLRFVYTVRFTEPAFNTRIGIRAMAAMAKKNGLTADDTPILKTTGDLAEFFKLGLIAYDKGSSRGIPSGHLFAINRVIDDPTKGAIAPDAFLLSAMKDGKPLVDEAMFSNQFGCLQKAGEWCQ